MRRRSQAWSTTAGPTTRCWRPRVGSGTCSRSASSTRSWAIWCESLRRRGLYDRSLIILTADHGVSFRPGGPRRVTTDREPAGPGVRAALREGPWPDCRAGRRRACPDRRHPADARGRPRDLASLESRRALGARPGPSARRRSCGSTRTSGGSFAARVSRLERRRDELLEQKISLFGDRDRGEGLYRFGPHRELVGRRVASLDAEPADGLAVELDLGDRIRVDPESGTMPAMITGRLSGEAAGPGLDLAVSVDGRVEAVTRSYVFRGDPALSALVPEASLSAGMHRIEIFRGRCIRTALPNSAWALASVASISWCGRPRPRRSHRPHRASRRSSTRHFDAPRARPRATTRVR